MFASTFLRFVKIFILVEEFYLRSRPLKVHKSIYDTWSKVQWDINSNLGHTGSLGSRLTYYKPFCSGQFNTRISRWFFEINSLYRGIVGLKLWKYTLLLLISSNKILKSTHTHVRVHTHAHNISRHELFVIFWKFTNISAIFVV